MTSQTDNELLTSIGPGTGGFWTGGCWPATVAALHRQANRSADADQLCSPLFENRKSSNRRNAIFSECGFKCASSDASRDEGQGSSWDDSPG